MNQKEVLLITLLIIISSFTLLLLPSIVSAGCCIMPGLGCEDKDAIINCSTAPRNFTSQDCSDRPECVLGCCCDYGSSTGTALLNISCEYPSTFIPDPALTINSSCTCIEENYSVSGMITRKTGGPVPGAKVSAASRTNQSRTNGGYTLTGVPAGTNVLVRARKTGCLPGSTIITKLDSDKTNIDIMLNCVCAPETCNATNNAYCKLREEWQIYDLTNITQKNTYCSLCGPDDPADCGVPEECVSNDTRCPVGCTPATDSDCICSDTPNMVCPLRCSSDQNAGNYDADCVHLAICGDGYVTYPYETCEDTPAPGQISLCNPEQCANPSERGACNCLDLSGCGNFIIEPGEACEIGMLCSDGSQCENCECGAPECVGDAINPSITASFDAHNKIIIGSWSLLDACIPSITSYSVFKCSKGAEDACSLKKEFQHLLDTPSSNFSDSIINQASEYCYYVQAVYTDGSIGESSIVCERTGSYYCMDAHPEEFCMGNIRSMCDENNNIEPVPGGDCNPDKFCMGPDRDGNTWCSETGFCDLCNGLYGMFSNLDLRVQVNESGYLVSRYCHPGTLRQVVQGCYLDRTKTLFSAFDYCANILSCYDYKSYDACTDPADPCDKNKACEWEWLNNNYPELGGICRPKSPELQQCELCDNEKYNWLSPGCTPAVCRLFGEECYYQGAASTHHCTKKTTLSCLDYATQEDCIGGRSVSVDADYDTNGTRISGTHQVVKSNDAFGLGKCYWDSTNEWCLRNADNYPEDNLGLYGADCRIGDKTCEADFSSPITTILPSGFSIYPADIKIRFSVTDNTYYGDNIKTYFCITPSDASCYPTELATNGVFEATITAPGDKMPYKLYYYSEDAAKNLEVVKSMNIIVDTNPPLISVVSPKEETFPTAQTRVEVEGVASLDTKNICTYKSGSTTKNCINNCLLTGQVTPCINSTTGLFNINVSVPSENALYNILFDAQDFAGNKVTGWSLLAIYHNESPPRHPVMINITEAVNITETT